MIAIVADSNCMLPPAIAERNAVTVIPLPVMVNNTTYLEGVNLDTDDFYDQLASGATVTTSQPSPGSIAEVYRQLIEEGATAIVSVHVGKHLSGTLNSARLAGQMVDVEVELVDTESASFPIGLSALAASETAMAGGSVADCVDAAVRVVKETRNAFVLSALDFVRDEGRVRVAVGEDQISGIPVVAMSGQDLTLLGDATDVGHASDLMVAEVAKETLPCRVGIGVGGREAFDFYGEIRQRLEALTIVQEIIEYRCGPSVGAYSGPGVAGMAWTSLSRG
jgi:DegV family protein with EDD domain